MKDIIVLLLVLFSLLCLLCSGKCLQSAHRVERNIARTLDDYESRFGHLETWQGTVNRDLLYLENEVDELSQ